MARIQFTDFDDAVFSTNLVCPPPLHPGAHTDNVQLLQLASTARVRFFAWLGYRETNVEGVQIFVGDQAVQYKAEAFPAQAVQVHMAVRDWAAKGFDLVYRLVDADSGQVITLGKLGIVCVDRQSRRPCAVPEVFKGRVLDLEALAMVASA
ncbi:MAG: thioesterase family protein [Comamonadaceae bacterium]|nr:thioesterase family protein [Comamonadaceae bacterium]